jgi:hypothetical protein
VCIGFFEVEVMIKGNAIQVSATSVPERVFEWETSQLVISPATPSILSGIVNLAKAYPYPHSVLGHPSAEQYVRQLDANANYSGWYAATIMGEVVAAAYLSVYGIGDGDCHTLWKIRHPMLAQGMPAGCLAALFNYLSTAVLRLRSGTAKLVIFLSEYEAEAITQIENAGFQCEGRFKDYYRLGELCLVYCKTVP